MVSRRFLIAILIAAAAAALSRPAPARAQEFSCGTDASLLAALAKPSAAAQVSGAIKVTVFRVAFKDKAYSTDTADMRAVHDRVSQFYKDNSCKSLALAFRFHPSVIKAPENGQVYADNWEKFTDFMKTKLHELGLAKGEDFDRYVVNFPSIKLDWVGLSSGPSSGANYVNGNYNAGVVAHELGHAVGLPHAAAMEAGPAVVGAGSDSERVEYGDPFDVMGKGGVTGHFNAWFKKRLGWMPDAQIKEVGASGKFRLYAHDNPEKSGKLLALRAPAGNGRYWYWIEYRTSYASTYVNSRHSAGVRMEDYFASGKSALLDMSPGSRAPEHDFNDANLEEGREFKDPFGNFTLKVQGVNEGVWDENGWVDVDVTWTRGVRLLPFPARAPAVRPGGLPELTVDARGRLTGVTPAPSGVFFPAAGPVPARGPASAPRAILR